MSDKREFAFKGSSHRNTFKTRYFAVTDKNSQILDLT